MAEPSTGDPEDNVPDVDEDLGLHLEMLVSIAEAHGWDSPEGKAIWMAREAILYVSQLSTKRRYEEWLLKRTQPFSAIEILNAKLCGIEDLPHELLDDTMIEIEAVLERLRKTMK